MVTRYFFLHSYEGDFQPSFCHIFLHHHYDQQSWSEKSWFPKSLISFPHLPSFPPYSLSLTGPCLSLSFLPFSGRGHSLQGSIFNPLPVLSTCSPWAISFPSYSGKKSHYYPCLPNLLQLQFHTCIHLSPVKSPLKNCLKSVSNLLFSLHVFPFPINPGTFFNYSRTCSNVTIWTRSSLISKTELSHPASFRSSSSKMLRGRYNFSHTFASPILWKSLPPS